MTPGTDSKPKKGETIKEKDKKQKGSGTEEASEIPTSVVQTKRYDVMLPELDPECCACNGGALLY